MDDGTLKVDLEHIEGYRFRVRFDREKMGELITDETEEIGGKEEGPNPSRLLAAASLNCLMASLIFCLEKKRVDFGNLKGEVVGKVERVDGRLRVTHLDVKIKTAIQEDDEKKLQRCVDIFEDYCVVTESIRNGIDVDVSVEPEV